MATGKKREGSNGQTEIDDEIMKAVEMAMENFGFCPNRIWAAVRNLRGREQNLPNLFPTHGGGLGRMFPDEGDKGNHENDRKDGHSRCNFDFCQQSQANFTSVEQRHESPSCEQLRRNKLRGCDPLKDLFSRDILDKAVEKGAQGEPTAWQLNGRRIIESNQKFMAISHVWSDGTGTGAWDGFRVNRCLYHFFRKIAREFGCEGIWWDTICIPNNKTLRAKALTNMHHNYEKAEITIVHDCFLRNLEWVDAETACLAIVMSPWFSRGWTALELAKSRKEKGTVKVTFKGPVFKDLDDIIATSANSSRRHQIASQAIFKLRNESIDTIDDLLTVLGSRHTSWLKDMAIISGLLVGCEIKETDSQQDIYQRILLEHCENVCHGHLFHNLPTISKGFSWCPISLLDMPLASSKTTLSIGQKGEVVGEWKVFPLKSIKKKKYIWKDTHPLIEAKLRSSLKQKDHHRFLVEPEDKSIKRALLVKILEETPTKFRCQFVGSMYFHPPEELGENQAVEVTIANTKGTEEIEAQACNEVKAGTKVQKGTDKHHPDIVEAEEGVRQIVQHQPNSEPHDLNGRMETQAPVDKGKTEAVCASEGEGDPNSQNLLLLSEAKEVELVQLIGRGANVDFQDKYGRTPLSLAAKEGKEALVKLLLETRKVNIGSKDRDGRTPMSWAAEGGHEAVVKLLLERYDVQYDSMDNANHTPLQRTAEGGHEAVVEVLAKQFESQYDSKDKDGRTPLSRAAEGGHEAVARLLLKWYEIDVESKDNDDWTPLWRAAYNEHEAVVKLLIETGKADVEAREKIGWTPLWWAVHKGNEAMVKLLLEAGKADVEARDINRRTPLFQAAGNGNEAMVKLLLKTCKADVEARDNLGQTPLFKAGKAVVKLLLETYKADVEARDNLGQTPLSFAAGYGHEAVVKLLLETGKADVEAKDNLGQTPLFKAGNEAVVKLLLETYKADVEVRDNLGQTPLSLAAGYGHEAVVKLLLETGKIGRAHV